MTDWKRIEDVWQAWIRSLVQLPCVWANYDAPAPHLPYITLDVVSIEPMGAYDETRYKPGDAPNELLQQDIGYRRARLSIQVDAVPTRRNIQARSVLSSVQDALHRPLTRAYFRHHDIAIIEVGRILSFGFRLRDTLLSRANIDVSFVVETSHSENVGSLPDDIEISGEVKPS